MRNIPTLEENCENELSDIEYGSIHEQGQASQPKLLEVAMIVV